MAGNPFDREILKWILEAVQKSFAIQANVKVEMKSVSMDRTNDKKQIDIVSMIGISSSKYNGVIAICFPKDSFLKMVSRMLGEEFKDLTADIADAAGEMLNITYASARNNINGAGHDFTPAIPTVVRGQDIKITHPPTAAIATVEYGSEAGPFFMEFSMKGRDQK